MGDWQPIETAPKDGTHILACRGPYDKWWGFNQAPPHVVHYWKNPGEEGFYNSFHDSDEPLGFTHWMPLPEPPISSPGAQGE